MSDPEIAAFRDYLLKGGFAFVSDYWGPLAREPRMRIVLPGSVQRRVAEADHRPPVMMPRRYRTIRRLTSSGDL